MSKMISFFLRFCFWLARDANCFVLRFIITPTGSLACGEAIATGSRLGSRNQLRKIKILDEANRNAPDPREDLDTIISHGLPRGSLGPVHIYALLRLFPFLYLYR